jgi:hypothetical protein
MSTTAATTIAGIDGFQATPTAQRADELAQASLPSTGSPSAASGSTSPSGCSPRRSTMPESAAARVQLTSLAASRQADN